MGMVKVDVRMDEFGSVEMRLGRVMEEGSVEVAREFWVVSEGHGYVYVGLSWWNQVTLVRVISFVASRWVEGTPNVTRVRGAQGIGVGLEVLSMNGKQGLFMFGGRHTKRELGEGRDVVARSWERKARTALVPCQT
ncbi:hypothetical protein PIB30_099337 [Stylosanthes scabra]|uniref:Uncharacterized protein n=1 Tax=Stylosanthes scabra TaxID=79078 RepID=A0ABU6YUH1_9FABA|nr:hypothetical protein [Stylosanthes scabra]